MFIDDVELIFNCLKKLIENKEIIVEKDKYYLSKIYEAEKYISKRIFSLSNKYDKEKIVSEKIINKFEVENNIKFNKEQKKYNPKFQR